MLSNPPTEGAGEDRTEVGGYLVDQQNNLNEVSTSWWGWSGPISILPYFHLVCEQVMNVFVCGLFTHTDLLPPGSDR